MLEPRDAADPLGYGDVCWIDEHGRIPFYDVHVRPDLTPLRPIKPDDGEVETPGLAPSQGRIVLNKDQYVLAHGEVVAAVLIDDPCQIEDVLGREGKAPSGRLMCATVRGAAGTDEMKLTQKFSILPVHDIAETLERVKPFMHGAVIDVERLFVVHITAEDDLAWLTGRRVGRLREDDSERLLWRVAAHAVRRGPLVAEDAGRKLKILLDQISHPASGAVSEAFSTLLGRLFLREGEIEDAISLIYDAKLDPGALPDSLDALYVEIEQLVAAARAALM